MMRMSLATSVQTDLNGSGLSSGGVGNSRKA